MELDDLRGEIDAVDRELVRLLARRRKLSKAAQAVKAARGVAAYDPERERVMLEARTAWAQTEELPPEDVRAIFATVLSTSR